MKKITLNEVEYSTNDYFKKIHKKEFSFITILCDKKQIDDPNVITVFKRFSDLKKLISDTIYEKLGDDIHFFAIPHLVYTKTDKCYIKYYIFLDNARKDIVFEYFSKLWNKDKGAQYTKVLNYEKNDRYIEKDYMMKGINSAENQTQMYEFVRYMLLGLIIRGTEPDNYFTYDNLVFFSKNFFDKNTKKNKIRNKKDLKNAFENFNKKNNIKELREDYVAVDQRTNIAKNLKKYNNEGVEYAGIVNLKKFISEYRYFQVILLSTKSDKDLNTYYKIRDRLLKSNKTLKNNIGIKEFIIEDLDEQIKSLNYKIDNFSFESKQSKFYLEKYRDVILVKEKLKKHISEDEKFY